MKGVDTQKGFYLLDPDNNLPRTQKRLKDFLNSTEWNGITAKRPSHDEFKKALSKNDLFIYIGHGSGSQYLPGELVEGSECRSLVLLYGCSSVKLASRGRQSDPWGTVLNYLIASCPCIVGMLWEVTDKDTDYLTKEMLSSLLGRKGVLSSKDGSEISDVALLVSKAKASCNWYLNAAALTVYGLPLNFISS